jgi:hypothetical protein
MRGGPYSKQSADNTGDSPRPTRLIAIGPYRLPLSQRSKHRQRLQSAPCPLRRMVYRHDRSAMRAIDVAISAGGNRRANESAQSIAAPDVRRGRQRTTTAPSLDQRHATSLRSPVLPALTAATPERAVSKRLCYQAASRFHHYARVLGRLSFDPRQQSPAGAKK